MPTATEDKVYIRWLKSEFKTTDDASVLSVKTSVELFIDGVRLVSVYYWTYNTATAFSTALLDALETKRQQYVSA